MDDASLDDFLNGDDEASSDETGDVDNAGSPGDAEASASALEEGNATETTAEADDGSPPEETADPPLETEGNDGSNAEPDRQSAPARSTMTFSPDGGECSDCGERVARRWTDGDRLVCRVCKEW